MTQTNKNDHLTEYNTLEKIKEKIEELTLNKFHLTRMLSFQFLIGLFSAFLFKDGLFGFIVGSFGVIPLIQINKIKEDLTFLNKKLEIMSQVKTLT